MNRRSFLFQFGALFIFLLVSIGVVFFAEGYRYREDEGLIKTSIIDFSFNLPEAILFIDGEKIEQKFPCSVKVEPGWHTIRIEKAFFYPWEKQLYADKDQVAAFKELFLAPIEIDTSFFRWNIKATNYQIIRKKPGVFVFFNKDTLVSYLFDLNRADSKMLVEVVNIPKMPIEKAEESSLIKDENISESLLGKAPQKIVIKKNKLTMLDEDLQNEHQLFAVDNDIFESSEDNEFFAAISGSALKVFSIKEWNVGGKKWSWLGD